MKMTNLSHNKKVKRITISGAAIAILSVLMATAIVPLTTMSGDAAPTNAYAIIGKGGAGAGAGGGKAPGGGDQGLKVGTSSFVNGVTITGVTMKTPSIETITLSKTGNGTAPSMVLGIIDRQGGMVGGATLKGGWTNSKSVDIQLTHYNFLRNPLLVRVVAFPLTSQS
jgi:hypothetical protein